MIFHPKQNKSPLRYPGGKTRACQRLENILSEHFDVSQFDTVLSPFFGGGSFEFYLQNKYDWRICANDKFTPLYTFWKTCKNKKELLCENLSKHLDTIDKDKFKTFRDNIMEEKDDIKTSVMFFVLNRCSFSGSTLSGGFSLESSTKRFTSSSIERVEKLNLSDFEICNFDFEKFLEKNPKGFIFADPPYFLKDGSKLYGNTGDLHTTFDHERLFKCLSKRKNWLLTYNNSEYIKNLYKDFLIIETSWSYGMNKSKKSSEIVIVG